MPQPEDNAAEPRAGTDAYSRLIAAIRAGTLGPRDRLVETELAAQLGISRTPVREAIRQLEAEGLVAHVPRVGATIRALDYAEVMELYEMRGVLEGTAARLAARAASDIELNELAAIHEEMANSLSDSARLCAINVQFHRALLNAAKNRFLVDAVGVVQKTMLILGPSTMEEGERARDAVREHAAVVTALAARDGDGAEAAMRQHIEAAHRARLRQLRQQDQELAP